jgi:Family of unknown function (DUF5522)
MDQNPPAAAPGLPALEPEDYYYEGSNLVFTAAYHLKRGSCCNSGCRHCPYGFADAGALAAPETAPED